jgi:hypothetical protein
MAKIEEPGPEEMGTWANQRRDEPIPASHDDDSGQSAVIRNEEHAEAHAAGRPGEPGATEQSAPAVQPAQPAEREPDEAGPGKAVRDMMPGPAPQGDVPDAPAVQVATTEGPGRAEGTGDEEDGPGPVRLVSNAVPGKPDGEVDTRP